MKKLRFIIVVLVLASAVYYKYHFAPKGKFELGISIGNNGFQMGPVFIFDTLNTIKKLSHE